MLRRSHALLLGLCAGTVLIACSEGTVTAPQGGSILLEASPAAVGLGESSVITALVRDQNGNPVRSNVEVLFFTDLGSIDRAARTSSQGLATATLTAGDTPGTATVRAVAGSIEATTAVQIGVGVGGLTLEAEPDAIPDDVDSEIALRAVVRDGDGNPLEGSPLTFSSELGDLESGGGPVFTDPSGEARDVLAITAEQAGSWDRPTFVVTASTQAPDGDILETTVLISVQSVAPSAGFTAVSAGGTMVRFCNQSSGQEPLTFEWDFENDGVADSTEREPTHDYGVGGTYTVKLTVRNTSNDEDIEQKPITVPIAETECPVASG